MTALPKPAKLTVAEYLAIENAALRKSEFYNGEMFAMAGANFRHNAIAMNLSIEIGSRLKGKPCRVSAADQRVQVERTGLFCYPDHVIHCGPPEFAANDPLSLVNPVLIVEVLSESTEKYDRTTKFKHYKQIETLKEYVLVAQDEPLCERYIRQDDGSWAQVTFDGLEASMELKAVPMTIPLAEIYSGVTFPEATGR